MKAMYCVRCGAAIGPNHPFCPSCGSPQNVAPAAPAPPAAGSGRVATHLRTLGILWLVLSALRLWPGFVMMPWLHHGFYFPHMPAWGFGFLSGLRTVFMLSGVLGIIAGAGLLGRQPWARILAIVLGIISLLHFPFGTALGIYTLWVLLPAESEREFRQAD